MDSLGQLEKLFAHDAWANRETLAALRAARPVPDRALRFFGHVIACGFLWRARIRREKSPLPVWPELTLDGCATRLEELTAAWAAELEALDPGSLAHEVTYTNSAGERWTGTVEAILLHVCLHAHYHRGQIASALRAAGHAPPATDFIHGSRQGRF